MHKVTKPLMKRLLILLIHFKDTSSLLEQCERCERISNADICVINNEGSKLEKLDYPVLENGQNLGFGAAINKGIAHFLENAYDYVLYLNNDVQFNAEIVWPLIAKMDSEDWNAIGPTIKTANAVSYGGRHPLLYQNTRITNARNLGQLQYIPGTFVIFSKQGIVTHPFLDVDFFFGGEMAFLFTHFPKNTFGISQDYQVQHNQLLGKKHLAKRYYNWRSRFLLGRKLQAPMSTYINWSFFLVKESLFTLFTGRLSETKVAVLALLHGLLHRKGRNYFYSPD